MASLSRRYGWIRLSKYLSPTPFDLSTLMLTDSKVATMMATAHALVSVPARLGLYQCFHTFLTFHRGILFMTVCVKINNNLEKTKAEPLVIEVV